MALARYKELVDRLAADIREGRLTPGTRLPTHRKLAAREGLALVTATRVYAELEAMGLVSGEKGRGTFVRETLLPRNPGMDAYATAVDMTDLSFNYPSLPGQADMLRASLRRLAGGGDLEALLRYQPHGGRAPERASVARHLGSRGLAIGADQVAIVNGTQHGLATTAMALLQPGDVVAVDALTYPGFKLVAETQHLEIAALPAAGAGPDVDALEALCKRRRVKAVYVMPTLHNPLGWVMSASRRRQLVAVARRHGLVLIEDAAYAFLEADPPPPLAALAPELTVYVSGLSKSVATGLRVGFVAAPAAWLPKIERAIRATTWNTPAILTSMACSWIDDGTVARLEAEKRQDAISRQAVAGDVLSGRRCTRHPASYFVWVWLPEEVRADRVARTLMSEHVSVSTAEPYATTAHVPHALRLALGSVGMEALRAALQAVRRVIDDQAY
ncbi:PLP-dependent aminotransferase family protein [Variovorax sp. OV329]|uniref:aminotransferase-like domain-containing protein n=1 Tax=Variovorax sp. OV329 TaxID=1882825 RepID=UPI0008F26BE0|nr:PLP-dependent aminotransferase family protein [Variovorax sp. OV329]SFM20568.1 transcriptional regulator, GntR family [Variovorax sp. OV329]